MQKLKQFYKAQIKQSAYHYADLAVELTAIKNKYKLNNPSPPAPSNLKIKITQAEFKTLKAGVVAYWESRLEFVLWVGFLVFFVG